MRLQVQTNQLLTIFSNCSLKITWKTPNQIYNEYYGNFPRTMTISLINISKTTELIEQKTVLSSVLCIYGFLMHVINLLTLLATEF